MGGWRQKEEHYREAYCVGGIFCNTCRRFHVHVDKWCPMTYPQPLCANVLVHIDPPPRPLIQKSWVKLYLLQWDRLHSLIRRVLRSFWSASRQEDKVCRRIGGFMTTHTHTHTHTHSERY